VTALLFGALAVTMDPHGKVRKGAVAGMVVIAVGAVILQAGYVLAPWLVPRGGKTLCLGLMTPVALFVFVLLVRGSTFRAGSVFSEAKDSSAPAGRNAFAAYALLLSYVVPPILLLFAP